MLSINLDDLSENQMVLMGGLSLLLIHAKLYRMPRLYDCPSLQCSPLVGVFPPHYLQLFSPLLMLLTIFHLSSLLLQFIPLQPFLISLLI